jgi:hypothetical protein
LLLLIVHNRKLAQYQQNYLWLLVLSEDEEQAAHIFIAWMDNCKIPSYFYHTNTNITYFKLHRDRSRKTLEHRTYPLLNLLKGGRMMTFFSIMHCLPIRTLAKSPRIITPSLTIDFPFITMFWDPQRTVLRLTLFPEAC